MNFFKKIRVWKVISVSVVLLMCTSIYGTTVEPWLQFLEVVNYSNKNVTITSDYVFGVQESLSKPGVTVAPGIRQRFPDALSPGMRYLNVTIGSVKLNPISIQVSDYVGETFLYGKQLTIGKRGDYNVKPVRFFHGIWRIKQLDPKGVWLEWELNFSHVNKKVKGSFTEIKTGENTVIDGALNYSTWTFNIAMPASVQVNGELNVTADGVWKGNLKASYMDDGKRESTVIPLVFEVDYKKKILVFIE
ncbi:hypothetical protein ACFLT9_01740 [Acidobacteriota bacterium]